MTGLRPYGAARPAAAPQVHDRPTTNTTPIEGRRRHDHRSVRRVRRLVSERANCLDRPGGPQGQEALMALVVCDMSISLDGYVTGPNASRQNPLGEGGGTL